MRSRMLILFEKLIKRCVAPQAILLMLMVMSTSVLAEDKAEVFVQLGHTAQILSVAISKDGKYALSGSWDNTLRLWDVSSGKEIRPFIGHTSIVNSVALSPDGKYAISGSNDSTMRLWDVATGKEIKSFAEDSDWINSVAFSPDGKYALSGGSNKVKIGSNKSSHASHLSLWDVKTMEKVRSFAVKSTMIDSVTFSPDGKFILTGSQDKIIRLWDVSTGNEVKSFVGHTGPVNSVAFSPDGRLMLSGGGRYVNGNAKEDMNVRLWDVASGKVIFSLAGHLNPVHTVTFSPNGRYAMSGSWESLCIWDVVSGEKVRSIAFNSDSSDSVAFSPDGKFVLVGVDNRGDTQLKTLNLWDIASGNKIRTFSGDSLKYSYAGFTPDSKSILTRSYKNLLHWDLISGNKTRSFVGLTGYSGSFSISPDGHYALYSNQKWAKGVREAKLQLWDVFAEKEIKSFYGGYKPIAFSRDSKFVLSGSIDGSDNLRLWNVSTGEEIRSFSGHKEEVISAAFSSDGNTAISASRDETVRIWNVTSGKEIRKIMLNRDFPYVIFSPDLKYAFSGGRWSNDENKANPFILWDLGTGKKIRSLSGDKSGDVPIAFSPDGKFVLSRGPADGTIRLWSVSNGRLIQTFKGHTGEIKSTMFSLDMKFVLSAGSDATTRLWDISSGKELVKLVNYNDDGWIVITPEGYYNSSENGDKHLNVRVGNNVYGIDQYREKFYRPDLVKLALAGKKLEGLENIANVKQAPRVSIVNTPTSVTNDDVTLTLKITDIGGGIGDVRLYLNGSAIVLDSGRGLKVTAKDDSQSVLKSYTVKLVKGTNSIRAIAFNAENSMQSTDVTQEITASFKTTSKPTLHALVIGINDFKNPKLQLKYSVADADLFADTLGKSAAGLFEKVNIRKLTTKEETTSENIKRELTALKSLNPDDLFVLYVASHGTVDDGEYFLITSNVGSTSTAKLKSDALTQTELKGLVANIPTTKKVIVLDTCNAGAMGDAMQVAMLTRGMSEDTAIKILSRAVGSTILSASTSAQEAIEGYQGHGLFTWVLSEGLNGKADKSKSGFVKTTDLADYLDSEVPDLAEKVFKRAQYPSISISGQPFHIGKSGR